MTTPTPTPGPSVSPNLTQAAASLGITPEELAKRRADSAATSTTAADRKVPSVAVRDRETGAWMGYQSNSLFGQVPVGTTVTATNSTRDAEGKAIAARTVSDVTMDILRMNENERATLGQKLVDGGFLQDNYSRTELEKVWGTLVGLAADWHDANPTTDLTPEDMIDLYGYKNGGLDSSKPSVRTVVSKDRDLSSPLEARNLLEQMMFTHLGRAPTAAEADDFQAALNSAQSKNPLVTTSTTNYDSAGRVTGNETDRTGGMSAAAAEQFAKNDVVGDRNPDSEYGRYQMATTYTNALMRAMGGG